MVTNGEQTTTMDNLMANAFGHEAEPAAAPAMATEQPLPPDVDGLVQPQPADAAPAALTQAPEPAAAPPQPHMVPLSELLETRKRAQFAEDAAQREAERVRQYEEQLRRLTQPQRPQPQPIDPEIDPVGAYHALRNEMQETFQTHAISLSRSKAIDKYGEAEVMAAANAAHAVGLANVFATRADPFAEVMRWHQAEKLRTTIGSDPTAYRAQIEAEVRAKIIAEMKQGTPPPANLTTPLSAATRVNNGAPVIQSDEDFFKNMMNRKRA
jgi:hypothetical protein